MVMCNHPTPVIKAAFHGEWDDEKNSGLGLDPAVVPLKSSSVVAWWKCDLGHSYPASPYDRALNHYGCPYCSGRKVLAGFNDVASQAPGKLMFWDFDANEKPPTAFTKGSHKKVWLKCGLGHSWLMQIHKIKEDGQKCPVCMCRKLTPGVNDAYTVFYNLEDNWVNPGDAKNVVFIHNKARLDVRCDTCGVTISYPVKRIAQLDAACGGGITTDELCACGGDPSKWFRSVHTVRDVRVREGDYGWRLSPEYPDDQRINASTELVFVCTEGGHRHTQTLGRKLARGQRCPYCSGKKASKGVNDFATMFPDAALLWDHKKNTTSPGDYTPHSGKKVWWKCDLGHSWQASIDKISCGRRCPYCSGNKVLAGFNDLPTTNPELLGLWDFKKNDDLGVTPTDYTVGSGEKVWWRCHQGHSYYSRIVDRVRFGCPYCAGQKTPPADSLLITHPVVAQWWDESENALAPDGVLAGSGRTAWWTCEHGHRWVKPVREQVRLNSCPVCTPPGVSAQENELFEYVETLLPGEKVLQHNRSVIAPRELDVYIPGRNIAIEYNGLYWHSTAVVQDKNYHYRKWLECRDKGVQLITVWEDEWLHSKNVVKRMLAHKLGVSDAPKVYARNTAVCHPDTDAARLFAQQNHIQGFVPGSVYIGLKASTGGLVALSIWRKNKDKLYLDRYCTSNRVVGGMGKLLKAGKQYARSHNCSTIVTFADHVVSDGGLYEKLGFTPDKELPPDYHYVDFHAVRRVHKFNYRLKRFKNDPELQWMDGLTETQLAELNGIVRIFDQGKTRYVMGV